MNGYAQAAILGIDLGTNDLKVLVTSPDGRIRGRAVAGYPVSGPGPGRAEASPGDWWAAARRAVPAALAEAGEPAVTGLAVTGTMHGIVLTDDRGASVRPAILGTDQRATAEVALYQELPGDYTAALSGRPSPGMSGPLLCWLASHEPYTLRHSWWALQPRDWLRLRLTGQAATDPSGASATLLFDLAENDWSAPLIGKLGLPREKLPPVRCSAATSGRLLAGPAAELGLLPGIPVAAGAGDTAAALLAADLRPGDALLNLGRGAQWVVSLHSLPGQPPAPVSQHRTRVYRSAGDGYCRLAAVPDTGLILDRFRRRLDATWDELYSAASRPRPPRRVRDRDDLMRAALDDVAARLREGLDQLRAAGHHPRRVVLGGTSARYRAWRGLLEEALALPFVPAPAPAGWLAAAGAARLAALTA